LSKLNQQTLEERIVKIESQMSQVDQELADPDIYRDGAKVAKLQQRRAKLAEELTPLEEEWANRAKS